MPGLRIKKHLDENGIKYSSDGEWFWEDREEGLEVIAWQPLPEAYKDNL